MSEDLEQAADGMSKACKQTRAWLLQEAHVHIGDAELGPCPDEANSKRDDARRCREVAANLAKAVAAYEKAKDQ